MFSNANKDDSKKKGTKRKKKKAPVEPQKPSSAYALFFRDTQAAIKAENSTATFGEISKIVASMWDSLSEDAKQVYKQKTEAAKKEYLKQLAVYRAYMVSKGGDMEEEDSQPLSVLREKMAEERASSTSPKFTDAGTSKTPVIDLTASEDLPPPPKLHLAPGVQLTESVVKLRQLPSQAQGDNNNSPLEGAPARPISPGPVLTKIIVPGQNGSQSTIHIINSGAQGAPGMQQTPGTIVTPAPPTKHIVLKPIPTAQSPGSSELKASTSAAPPPIQLRNIVSHPTSPVTILPSKPGQIIKVLQSETGEIKIASIPTTSVKGRIIKMVDVVHPTAPSASNTPDVTSVLGDTRTTSTVQQPQVQPILQLLAQESTTDGVGTQGAGGAQGAVGTNSTPPVTPVPLEEPFTIDLITDTDEPMSPDEELLPMDTSVPADPSDTHVTDSPDLPENDDHEPTPRLCIREGCVNIAVSNPMWDDEYCSSECVFSHCKDVFNAWVSARQVAVA